MSSGLRVTGRLLPNCGLSSHGMSSTHVIACQSLGRNTYFHTVSYEIRRQCIGTNSRKRVQSNAEPRKAVDKVRDAPSLTDAPQEERNNNKEVSKERVQSAQDATVGPSVSNSGVSSSWKKVLRPFANLKLAIAELTAIAALSSIGTVIEQNKSAEFYVQNFPEEGNKVLGFLTYDIVFALQLDHIYSSNYFLVLLALLGMSLIACTMTTQLPMVKVAQRWRFRTSEASYQSLPLAREVENARLADFAKSLMDKNYQIFMKDGSLYAFKGLGGKLAPIGVHASMIFTMLGIVWGILGGFEGSAMIQEGDSAPFSSLLEPSTVLGIPPKGSSSSLKVDDFRIQYRPDGSIQQFFSDVSVEDRFGNVVQRQTISVNKPLRYGGITAYQTDWSMTAMSVSIVGQEKRDLVLPMAPLKGLPGSDGKLYGTFLPLEAPSENSKPKGISLLAKDLESVIVYDSKGSFVGVRRPTSKKPITVDGLEVVIQDIVASSGMELKSDPGVPLVYAGFGGICITTVLSYLSHSQAWGVQRGNTLVVGGKTNRALVGFQVELDEMLESLPEYSSK